jgi:hypothetical protein
MSLRNVARVFLIASAAAASIGQATKPVETAPAALDAKWTDLLTRLAADDFKTRDAAQKELAALPPAERPFLLRLAEQTSDPEVRSRLISRAGEMEEFLALNPPTVTLDMKDATLGDVLKEMSRQTGLKITGWPDWGNNPNSPLLKKVTVKVEKQPLWAALRAISKDVPMNPMHPSEGGDLQLQLSGSSDRGVSTTSGAAMITLNSLVRQYTVIPVEAPDEAKVQNTFSASFQLAIDPRVKIGRGPQSGALTLTEALDDKGNSLINKNAAPTQIWWQDGQMTNASISLSYPAHPGEHIKTLKGKLTGTVVVRSASAELDLPKDKAATATLNGLKITFKKFDAHAQQCNADVKIERGDMDAALWKQIIPGAQSSHPPRIELLNDKGEALRSNGYGGSSNEEELSYQFSFWLKRGNEDFKPAKLRITIPTKLANMESPFEFRDLPMP